jgi:hemolysin activation/secretion protein
VRGPTALLLLAASLTVGAAEDRPLVAGTVLREIVVEGNTLLPEEFVASRVGTLAGRLIAIEDVHALARELTEEYVRRGYVSSGVVIPEQALRDGRLTLRAVEGRLADVAIEGNERLSEADVLAVLEPHVEGPIGLRELQASVRALEDDPLVRRVDARLRPGVEPGAVALTLALEEQSPLAARLRFANDRPAGIGEEQGELLLVHRDLTGHRDTLRLSAGLSDGSDRLGASWTLRGPIRGLETELFLQTGDAQVVEAPFDDIDIESEAETIGVRVRYRALRTRSLELGVFGAFERERSESTLLGVPFDFELGSENGKARATVASLGMDGLWRGDGQALGGRLELRRGLDALNATRLAGRPDGRFDVLRAQAHFARQQRLAGRDWVVTLRAAGQYTDDRLQAFERLALGGSATVRGYRENTLLRDTGWYLGLETQTRLVEREGLGARLDGLLFVDHGAARDAGRSPNASRRGELASVGLGLQLTTRRGIDARLIYGYRLRAKDREGSTLQDHGLHFSLQWQWGQP